MRKTLLTIAALVIVAAPMVATVVNTKHDLSKTSTANPQGESTDIDQVCVFCHTPHQPSGTTTDPLWNHSLSAESTYSTYTSDTMNASPSNLATGDNVSKLCMSCHDGTVGVGNMYNDPNTDSDGTPSNQNTKLTGVPNLGNDLSNDHPVNFDYNSTLASSDGELTNPTSTSYVDSGSEVPLFGGKVQCASCHDPHDATYTPFLVVDNTGSALCRKCHTK